MSMVPCYVGLDYHDDTIRVCAIDEKGIGHLGREVRRGDVLVRDGLRVVVRKVRRHKLQEAQISRQATTSIP